MISRLTGPDDDHDTETLPLINDSRENTAVTGTFAGQSWAGQSSSRLSHPSSIILATTAFERFALYGITCNLPAFLGTNHHPVTLGLSASGIGLFVLLFTQLPYIGAFVAGTMADGSFGRFRVYLAALILQFVGSVLLLLSAVLEESEARADLSEPNRVLQFLAFTGLMCLGFGIACSSGTELPLGVDQYRPRANVSRDHNGPRAAMKFFARYFMAINIGATLSFTAVSFVQMNYHFMWGLLPVSVSYLASILCLVCFRKRLHRVAVRRSVLRSSLAVVLAAWRAKPATGERRTWRERALKSERFSEEEVEELARLGGVVVVLLSLVFYMAAYFQVGQKKEDYPLAPRPPTRRCYRLAHINK